MVAFLRSACQAACSLRLELDQDKFWLTKRYEKKFGHLSRAEQKKLKHKRTTIDGLKGILVPTDDGEGPFDLERDPG